MRTPNTIRFQVIGWLLTVNLVVGSVVGGTSNHQDSLEVPVQRDTTDIASDLDSMGQRILELAIVRSLVLTHSPVGTCPLLC
jgi:hypothetical protein